MTSLTITLPLPPKETHPNARAHNMAKAAAVKRQRFDAGIAAVAALNREPPPRWKAAKCQATFYTAKRQDRDNLIAWLKGTADGIQDAGIVANDSGIVYMPPEQVCDPKRTGERKLVLVIEEIA